MTRMRFPTRTLAASIPLIGLVTLALALGSSKARASEPLPESRCQPVLACLDERGCPDLVGEREILTNLAVQIRTFLPADCVVQEGMVDPGVRTLLLLSTFIANIGPGSVIIGVPEEHPELYDLETCHGHPHIKEFAAHRLWTVEGFERLQTLREKNPGVCLDDLFRVHPDLAAELVEGNKRGFCLFDVITMDVLSDRPCPHPLDPRIFPDCDFGGLSVCWADIYEPFIDGQWIDITDVPDGDYFLEVEPNARHFFAEADFTNNSASVKIRLHRGRVRVLQERAERRGPPPHRPPR